MQKEIREANDNLAEMEFGSGHHRWATIEPKINKITSFQHKLLDTLARLLTEKRDVCVAVYYKERKLIIANNWRRSNYAEQCLDVLQKIANNEERKKAYQELVWLSIVKQIHGSTSEKVEEKADAQGKNKLTPEEKEAFNNLKDFEEKIQTYKSSYHRLKKSDEQLNELLEKVKITAEELFMNINKLPEKSRFDYWECLSPLEDLNIIVNAIVAHDNSNEQEEIIKAIKKGEVEFIEEEQCKDIKENKKEEKRDKAYKDYETCTNYRSKKECNICEKNVMHAEMKIVSKILEERNSSMEIEEPTPILFEYIGISKLACVPCQITIDILNPERKEKCIRGTHGSTYRGWVVPHSIPEDIKRELLNKLKGLCLHEKVFESTGEIPEELTKVSLEQGYQGKPQILQKESYVIPGPS